MPPPMGGGGPNINKSVRFVEDRTKKRAREDDDDDDRKPAAKKMYHHHKKNQHDDEDMDDDYEKEDDDRGGLPSERELLEAKRTRRHKAAHMDDSDRTRIDDQTSLLQDSSSTATTVAIEPFHMERENSDGTGYFDGDTYVFRKGGGGEEADAWLDQLEENDTTNTTTNDASNLRRRPPNDEQEEEKEKEEEPAETIDSLSKPELYERILPLVSDTESVAQAVQRYGAILNNKKQRKHSKQGGKRSATTTINNENESDEMVQMAKQALNALTEAANALLFQGDVNIYDTTRNDIILLLQTKPSNNKNTSIKEQPPALASQSTKWEYKGNQDGQIHGPYTTEQMIGWTKAGYFVGAQAVQIRTIVNLNQSKQQPQERSTTTTTTQEDLMADLMEDSDDNEEEETSKQQEQPEEERGDWMSSDQVHFEAYLP